MKNEAFGFAELSGRDKAKLDFYLSEIDEILKELKAERKQHRRTSKRKTSIVAEVKEILQVS
jgi:hypothetical protein